MLKLVRQDYVKNPESASRHAKNHINASVLFASVIFSIFMIKIAFAGLALLATPPGIQYYLPITLTNYQGTAVTANTQIAIGTNFIGGNALSAANTLVTGFNALAYQQYEACNLQNVEFFFANGTVINSWLEGNILNEQIFTTSCSGPPSSDSLSSSANVLWWINYPWPSSFLPANTGTATTNTIYMGFASPSSSVINGNSVGEAPTLSTGYGQYDNGADIFNLYFNGDTPISDFNLGGNNQLQQVSGVTIGSDTNANVLYLTGYGNSDRYDMLYNIPLQNGNYVLESSYSLHGDLANNQGVVGLADTSVPVTNGNAIAVDPGFASSYFSQLYVSGGTANVNINTQGVATSAWLFGTINYVQTSGTWYAFTSPQLYSSTGGYSGTTINPLGNSPDIYLASLGTHQSSNPDDLYLNWERARAYPPNGILPATTFGSVTLAGCSASITTPSNSIVDAGQYQSFTASENDCASSFTYNILVANSITPSVITHNDLLTGQSANSITYTFQTTSIDISNSPEEANVIVTDSGTNTVTSGYSPTFTVNPALATPTLTSSPSLPSTQNVGNTITFTSSWTGGTSTYTANYLIVNTITGNLVANMLFTGITGTSNSFTWVIPSNLAGNTLAANVFITDSASTPETTNSVESGTLTVVAPALSTPTLSSCPSSAKLDVGQTVSCTATVSGGTGPYTYNWIVSNSITNAIVANMLFTGVSSTSNTFTYTTVSADTSNSPLKFNVIVTDSASTTVNSIYSGTFQVKATMSNPLIYPSNPTIDSGQSVTFSSTWTGGTPDYTAKLYSSSTSTCNTGSTLVQTLSSQTSGNATFNAISPTSNALYCIFVTDSATTPVTVNSVNSEVTINPALSSPIISPSNPAIDTGQPVTFTASWSGGTPTYGASIYSSPTSTCNQQSTLIQQNIGLTSNSVTFSTVSPSANTYYCIYVTDNTINSYAMVNSIRTISLYPGTIAIAPSGTYGYVTTEGGIEIINTVTNTITNTISTGISNPQGVAFSPSGTYAYVANEGSNNVVIINTASNTVVNSIIAGFNSPRKVAISPDGTYAYVANFDSSNIVIINTASNTVVNTITASSLYHPVGVAISPSGAYAYVATVGDLVIINTATNSVVSYTTSGINDPYEVAFSPSGTYAYIGNCNACSNIPGDNVVIVNTATNSIVSAIPRVRPYGVAFSPSGAYAYISDNQYQNITVMNVETATTNSVNSYVTVNPALSIPTLTSSPALPSTQNVGNTITFTSSWTGGTSTYTANYLIVNTITGNLVANMLFTGITGTSNSFTWVIPSNLAGNTISANVFITDSATSQETTNSVKTGTLTVVAPALSIPVLSSCPSAIKVEAFQSVSCTATVSGGTSPYTYNWLMSNSVTGAIVANTLYTGIVSASNTLTYSITSSNIYPYTYNSPEKFNVIVTDSYPTTVNSVYSGNVYFTTSLAVTSLSPINPTIDGGQSITLRGSWSGGFSPYTANWYTGPSGNTCAQDSANVLATYSSLSATSNSITVTPTSTNSYCIGVTDSATTPVTQLSSNDVVFVNTALGTPSLTASNTPTVNTGQYEAFSSSWTGGTLPYTANYLVFNTVTDALVANALYTGITGTSNTFLWLVPTADAGNTISANVFIMDSASNPVTVNSIQLSSITISQSTTTSTTSTSTSIASTFTSTSSTSSTTLTTTVAPSGSGGGSGSGGIIIHPPSTSVSSTSTSSTTSTSTSISSTSSASTSSTSSTSTVKSTIPTSTIKPVIIAESAKISPGVVTNINFTSYNLTVKVKTNSNVTKNVTIELYKPVNLNTTLQNYTDIFSFYLNASSSEVSMNVTLVYNCKYGNAVAPFVVENGTLDQIYTAVLLQNPCRITFSAPNEHFIGLFAYTPKQTISSTTSRSTSVTTTYVQTELSAYDAYYIAAAVAAVAIIAYLIWAWAKNRTG